ncbi:hypothetical protein C7974DRAFT_386943 [Boeremia exigua]|uniref:uncharacterized protein n=1 Tax=Boeremia exigua TaxID=749465 RepID=UPI001E8E8933|nr:uncharacterized protein C7974DRAFT_386943 [Boeremia exigua]KAH6643166.1 hypothetical protein C7974DRAFT_386943 [Boeremia exigua]
MASVSQRSSNATTLAAFPIPPMSNPVGELPMLVSRANLPLPTSHQTASRNAMGTSSLDDTYRAITRVNMIAVLQRTRSRGERLQIIGWEELTSFERAWRDMNEVLLVAIYGRKDVVLDDSDVAYIDCIAGELDHQSNQPGSDEWVRQLFEDGISHDSEYDWSPRLIP